MRHEWFPFYIYKYLADCEELTLSQHGAYLRLMLWYYSTAKPIPNDRSRIMRRISALTPAERKAADFVLTNYFRLDVAANVYRHKRIDAELKRFMSLSETRSENANRRWIKPDQGTKAQQNNDVTNASAMQNRCKVDANAMPLHRQRQIQKPKKKTSKKEIEIETICAATLPVYVSRETWQGFIRMRYQAGWPLTDRAVTMLVNKLEELHATGQNVNACLEQSEFLRYRGVFPVGKQAGNQAPMWQPPEVRNKR